MQGSEPTACQAEEVTIILWQKRIKAFCEYVGKTEGIRLKYPYGGLTLQYFGRENWVKCGATDPDDLSCTIYISPLNNFPF